MNSLGCRVCVCVCVKRKGKGAKAGCLIVTHHSYESLFTTDGSPFPWVFFMPQWFIKENYNICFFSFAPCWYSGLWKLKSHVETWITGSYCCWMLMALERHFPCGCSWNLTGLFYFFLPLSPSCHRRRKKRHPRNHRRRKRRRKTSNSQRMLPHSTYWLTVNQNWAVSPRPVPPHDHCSRQSPPYQKEG